MTKKTNAPKAPKRSGRQPKLERAAPSAMPSRLSMDKTMADLSKLLASQQFESIDQANAFLQQMLSNNDGRIPELAPETPLEQAQALIAQAHEETSPKRQVALAKQALDLSPDCADAYCLLAELDPSADRKLEFLEQAVAAGERALGPEPFVESIGHFWGVIETRPYMRSLAGLAELSWLLGNRSRAIALYARVLELNPGDNQGVRYSLATCLLEECTPQAQATLSKLLSDYPNDAAANWAYSRALLSFQQEGGSSLVAQKMLKNALKANSHIPTYLLGIRRMPSELPRYIGFGDENEAIEYVAFAIRAWSLTPGAIAWLRALSKP
jgi:tetratricopeptide (TPR) repeat protein